MKRLAVMFALLCMAASAQVAPKAVPVAPPEEAPPAAAAPTGPTVVPERGFGAPKRAVSESGQFIVSGSESPLRAEVAGLAEETKNALLKLTEEKDEWKIPVRISLFGKKGDPAPENPVRSKLFLEDNAWGLEMNLHVARGIDRERFQRAVYSMLICERALRKLPPQKLDSPLTAPAWLIEGMQEAFEWKEDRGERKLYNSLLQHGILYKLADLFTVTEDACADFDSATRTTFRITAGALVMALIEQPQGKEGFARLLAEAPNFGGEMPVLLKRCFPDLNLSQTSLSKWVALKVAELKEAEVSESMGVEETDKRLAEALRVFYHDASGAFVEKTLESVWRDVVALPVPARREAVRIANDELARLSHRCFPSYRPLIRDYISVLGDVVKGTTAKTDTMLATLSETRSTMTGRAKIGRDYMDWFEITRAQGPSGAFENYLELKEKLKYEAPKRQDPISVYMDLMQGAFSRASKPRAQEAPGPRR